MYERWVIQSCIPQQALCAHAPREPASWALFHCVAARARLKRPDERLTCDSFPLTGLVHQSAVRHRPDERWTLRLLLKHQDSPPITLAVAHRCLMAELRGRGQALALWTASLHACGL